MVGQETGDVSCLVVELARKFKGKGGRWPLMIHVMKRGLSKLSRANSGQLAAGLFRVPGLPDEAGRGKYLTVTA